MKKPLLYSLILILSISMFGCTNQGTEAQLKEEQYKQDQQQNDNFDVKAVVNVVEQFGKKLQEVSLLAPKDIVKKSMQENYSEFVSQALLEKWISEPLNAPGRLTSSPWPDRIEILTIEKLSEYAYEVTGEIIEITSTEKVSGGIAAKSPITLVVKSINNRWIIDDVTLGIY